MNERIYLDKSDPSILHDEETVHDHALTRPWTVVQSYRRVQDPRPYWHEVNCYENNNRTEIGNEIYMIGPDGLLAPTRKDAPPPDLRFFKNSSK